MVPTINDNHGLIQQFLGDGITALFLNRPEDAIRAAIAHHKIIASYNRERLQKGRRALAVGIGLNTGALMLGILGNEYRMGASVVSDVVNTASRMEGLPKHFGVSLIVSEESFNQLQDSTEFNYRYLGKVQVKGKKKALGIYEFFDGESSESISLKQATKPDFERALQLYQNKLFEEALISFRKVMEANPKDKAAHLYYKRAAICISQGVSDSWDGVEVMLQK